MPLDLILNPHRIDSVPELPRSEPQSVFDLLSPQSPSVIETESPLGIPRTLIASSSEGDLPDSPSLSASSSADSLSSTAQTLRDTVLSCFPQGPILSSSSSSSSSASVVEVSEITQTPSFDFTE